MVMKDVRRRTINFVKHVRMHAWWQWPYSWWQWPHGGLEARIIPCAVMRHFEMRFSPCLNSMF